MSETAYSLGYAKILRDGWMPVEHQICTVIKFICNLKLRCDLTCIT